ncbi:hypothetical protein [Asaia lannensis]|uniref:hypothetical protein n=1 Tax=Asaia lannensis TaxID=415421 RepID=UPI00387371DF
MKLDREQIRSDLSTIRAIVSKIDLWTLKAVIRKRGVIANLTFTDGIHIKDCSHGAFIYSNTIVPSPEATARENLYALIRKTQVKP